MKIIVAPNAFKGSATAAEVAAAMARGVRRAVPNANIVQVPVADGGDGLHEIALDIFAGKEMHATVTGPRFEPVEAGWVVAREGELAVIEMARASGLALLGAGDLDPTRTTTRGTGELIRLALDHGARHVLVGIGGSATNDGGVGMAVALGWRFLDAEGNDVSPVGGQVERIATIDGADRDPRLAATKIEIACDVENPLCGSRGAAAVYGPQKGATAAQVAILDRGLSHLADLVASTTGTDDRDLPGAGAAGGLGFGLRTFANGVLRRGTDVIFDAVHLDEHVAGADLVITGEGRIDAQTSMGKAPAAVAARARDRGVPCIALAGSVAGDVDARVALGVHAVVTLCPERTTVEEAMASPLVHLEAAARDAVHAFLAGREGPQDGYSWWT